MVDPPASDASRRHMLRQARRITLFMRHGANLLVCLTVAAVPPTADHAIGRVLAVALGVWSVYRLATRSPAPALLAVDYATTIAACLATVWLVSGPGFYLANSAPVAIAGTAVISFTIATSVRVSFVLAVGIAAAFAYGASRVVGWDSVGDIFNLYYFALQWVTAALIRLMVLRVADSVDIARADRVSAELRQEVAAAVRAYDREQLRLLHDTVASTLMMVGDGTSLSSERLAAQARRDLSAFSSTSWAPQGRTDLVAALRLNAEHVATPVTFMGIGELRLDGGITTMVAAAAREALTNVDRHAGATAVAVVVEDGSVRIADDGRGFDTTLESGRHGIAQSIRGRMRGVGGRAVVTSRPGQGTTVELCWSTMAAEAPGPRADPERLIERTRTRFGLALVAYAVVNLLAMVPVALDRAGHPVLQWVLAAGAVVVTLSSISAIAGARSWLSARSGVGVLLVVTLTQSVMLPVDLLGTGAQWSQGVIGWCVLPLLLGKPPRSGAAVLFGCWFVPACYALIRDPSAHTVVNLGYGTASILIIQLCALFFDDLIRRAAATAGAETESRIRVAAAEGIADAVAAEYQRRYAELADSIRPILSLLADHGVVDAAVQRRAQVEYQRLRALFDQSTAFDHALMRELRPIVDDVQARGVAVSVTVTGRLPEIDDAPAHRLAQGIGPALAAACDSARVTVSGAADAVTVSAVCRGVRDTEYFILPATEGDDQPDLTIVDDTVWITVSHLIAGGSRRDVLADLAT